MNQRGIGVSNLPNLKYRSICKNGLDFNIMLIGAHGVGKSSFINGLFDTKIFPPTTLTEDSSFSAYSDSDSSYNPNKINFEISSFVILESEFKTRITITEVDCVGDFEDNNDCWKPIVKYIHDSYQDFSLNEHKNVRSLIKDKRIHVCFYFLEPNDYFIKPADIITMREVSKSCNLIPIVGKSDILNDSQKQNCFNYIREVIETHNISVFEEKIPARGDISNLVPPFFIISPIVENENISFVRKYPWGTLDILNLHSNDLFRLRENLISKNLLSLLESTEEYYDKFRAVALSYYINKKVNTNLNNDMINSEIFEKLKDEENKIKELKSRIKLKRATYETKLKNQIVKNESY